MGQKIHPLGFRLPVTQSYRATWFAKPRDYGQWVLQDDQLRQYFMRRYPDRAFMRINIERRNYCFSRYKFMGELGFTWMQGGQCMRKVPYDHFSNIWVTLMVDRSWPILKHQWLDPEFRPARGYKEPNKPREECLAEMYKIARAATMHIDKFRQYDDQPGCKVSHVRLYRLGTQRMQPLIIGQQIVKQLEKRKPYRRAVKQALRFAFRIPSWIPPKERKFAFKPYGVKIQISGRLGGAEMARTEVFVKGLIPLQTLRARIDYRYQTAQTLRGTIGIKVWVWHTPNQKDWDDFAGPAAKKRLDKDPQHRKEMQQYCMYLFQKNARIIRQDDAQNERIFARQCKKRKDLRQALLQWVEDEKNHSDFFYKQLNEMVSPYKAQPLP